MVKDNPILDMCVDCKTPLGVAKSRQRDEIEYICQRCWFVRHVKGSKKYVKIMYGR